MKLLQTADSKIGIAWRKMSEQQKNRICVWIYSILFLVTFLLSYSPFIQAGKSFVWSADGRNQHFPAMVYIGRYLRQVFFSILDGQAKLPLFDLNLSMGGDVIATLNYYGFGNPLYLLSAFVPTKYMEAFYIMLIILRIYLAGLAFIKLCKYFHKRISFSLVGAILYVFSGYVIFSAVRHPYFIEPMIQLPLLIVGIDMIMKKDSPLLFISAVFYSGLCGFYFLYMMTIMCGIYFLARFGECYKKGKRREFLYIAGKTMGAYLLGLGMSAPLFLPAVLGFLSSDRGESSGIIHQFLYSWNYYRNNALRLIAPVASWEALSLCAITLLALVALFVQHRGEYKALKIMLGVSVAIYVLPFGGRLMNGFSYASQRWTFGLVLLLSYIVVEMLPTLLTANRKQQFYYLCVLLCYGCITFSSPKTRTVFYTVGVAMLAVTLIVLLMFHGTQISSAIACIALVVGNVSIYGMFSYAADLGNYSGEFAAYGEETNRLLTAIERDAEPYLNLQNGRFDSSSFNYNLAPVWGVPSTNMYWSIICGDIPEFWEKTENIRLRDNSHAINGTNSRTYMSTLLSTKYFLEKKDRAQYVPYGYELIDEGKGRYSVYENSYQLPWGYTFDSYVPKSIVEGMSGVELEELMMQSIILEEDVPHVSVGTPITNIESLPYKIKSFDNGKWENGHLEISKDNAKLILEFQALEGVELYLRLQGFDINGSGQTRFSVSAKCEDVKENLSITSNAYSWYFGRKDYLVNFGYSENDRTTCTIVFPKKGTYNLKGIQVFALPMDGYSNQVEQLRKEPLENIVWETNRFSGTVDLSKNKILCVSIPYSRGWTVTVDGQKVEILKGNYMFMALPLIAGHHDIEFTYCTPGLKIGVSFSALSFLGVVVFSKKYKRREAEV